MNMLRLIERIGKIENWRPALMMLGLLLTVSLLVVVALPVPIGRPRTFTGEIQDSTCAGTAEHVERDCALTCVHGGAKWVLYDPSNQEIYQLDDQEAGQFAAQQVTVLGTLDKSTKTIHVVKIKGAITARAR